MMTLARISGFFSIFILLLLQIGCAADTAPAGLPEDAPQPLLTPQPILTPPALEAAGDPRVGQATTNCRYGIAKGFTAERVDWITPFAAGHYINFTTTKPSSLPRDVEYLPLIRIKQDKENGVYLPTYTVDPPLTQDEAGLGAFIKANPRALWFAGNEPDVANDAQDNTFPEVYARAYHEVYHFIKEHDPQAQVANAGLSMATPGRLQYLDIVWDTYLAEFGEEMPVDVWNLHLYILSEIRQEDGGHSDGKVALGTDPVLAKMNPAGDPAQECPKEEVYCRSEHDDIGLFIEQIVAMRDWMKAHGQQNKPLIISEYSLLYPFVDYDDPVNPTECFLMDEFGQCFTAERVAAFLRETMTYLESSRYPTLGFPADDGRLVQQWTWYSHLTDPEGSGGSSNLLTADFDDYQPGAEAAMTLPGRTFRDQALAGERTVNLVAGEAPQIEVTAVGDTAAVPLQIGFYNSGSTAIAEPFHVTFYADEAQTAVIADVVIDPTRTGPINGCAWGRETENVSITWTAVPPGEHTYWVKIDSQDQVVDETDEADNVAAGTVIVNQ